MSPKQGVSVRPPTGGPVISTTLCSDRLDHLEVKGLSLASLGQMFRQQSRGRHVLHIALAVSLYTVFLPLEFAACQESAFYLENMFITNMCSGSWSIYSTVGKKSMDSIATAVAQVRQGKARHTNSSTMFERSEVNVKAEEYDSSLPCGTEKVGVISQSD
ncbi:hypothetical protein FRC18_009660 [Serendipita sp. 400]|nr:hypothetical protein FRC18_009660 [Serendipita sp. 400]